MSEPFDKDKSPTTALKRDPKIPGKNLRNTNKSLHYIIVKDTKSTLAGNKCVMEITRKMGFEYLPLHKGSPEYQTEWGRFLHNFQVKFLLFFTRGPFWKFKVKKAIKDCRRKTGDFMG